MDMTQNFSRLPDVLLNHYHIVFYESDFFSEIEWSSRNMKWNCGVWNSGMWQWNGQCGNLGSRTAIKLTYGSETAGKWNCGRRTMGKWAVGEWIVETWQRNFHHDWLGHGSESRSRHERKNDPVVSAVRERRIPRLICWHGPYGYAICHEVVMGFERYTYTLWIKINFTSVVREMFWGHDCNEANKAEGERIQRYTVRLRAKDMALSFSYLASFHFLSHSLWLLCSLSSILFLLFLFLSIILSFLWFLHVLLSSSVFFFISLSPSFILPLSPISPCFLKF